MASTAHILRARLADGVVAAPGAWNGLVAHAVAEAGFEACYISGGATANACGLPDIGLVPLDEVCTLIRRVAEASGLPVIVDADTGYGDVDMAATTPKKRWVMSIPASALAKSKPKCTVELPNPKSKKSARGP